MGEKSGKKRRKRGLNKSKPLIVVTLQRLPSINGPFLMKTGQRIKKGLYSILYSVWYRIYKAMRHRTISSPSTMNISQLNCERFLSERKENMSDLFDFRFFAIYALIYICNINNPMLFESILWTENHLKRGHLVWFWTFEAKY